MSSDEPRLTHLSASGEAHMVDVGDKDIAARAAIAEGRIVMKPETLDLILAGDAKKGDVLGAARIAGIMAAKRTHELIPLCHPLALTQVVVDLEADKGLPGVRVRATAKVLGRTGVEMEALTAVSVACLTIYDMVKAADRFMRMAAVEYDPAAECPEWTARLLILQPDAVQRSSLQRLYGSTLTGLIDDQSFYVQQGKGGDGKSMTNIVMENLHDGYCLRASPKTFLEGPQKSGSDHQSDIVRLSGDIRMVVCDEPKRGSVWDGERIKHVTGSKVTARGAYARGEQTFVPRFKLIVECNPLPRAPSDDDGFRRRFKLFVWPVQLHRTPGLHADPPAIVERRLTAGKTGILNWLITGALDFLNNGRVIPATETMVEALGNYWEASSPLGEWMDAWCDLSDREYKENASALWTAFKEWCEAQGIEHPNPKTQTAFGRALSERHIMSVKGGKGVKYRRGVRLRSPMEVDRRDAEAGIGGDAAPAAVEEARSRWRPGDGDDDLG